MKLTTEEVKALGSELLNGELEQGRLSEIVTKITESHLEYSNDISILTAKNDSLGSENNSLREQNMALYLKVGTVSEEVEEEVEEEIEEEIEVEDTPIFDEKGNLL